MKTRQLTGYLFVALGFALIVLLGLGVVDPIGGAPAGPTSMGGLLKALAPSVGIALAAFLLGLWLLKGKRS